MAMTMMMISHTYCTFDDDHCDIIGDIMMMIIIKTLPGMSEGSVEILLIGCKVFNYPLVRVIMDQGEVTGRYCHKKMENNNNNNNNRGNGRQIFNYGLVSWVVDQEN